MKRKINRRKLADSLPEEPQEVLEEEAPAAESEESAEKVSEDNTDEALEAAFEEITEEKSEDSGLFFRVPDKPDEEEPAFGELIFGEKITGRRVEVKLTAEEPEEEYEEGEWPEEEYEEGEWPEEEYEEGEWPEEEYEEGEEPEELPAEGAEKEKKRRKKKAAKKKEPVEEPEEEPDEEEIRRKQEERARRKEELKKELQEQLRKEKEEQQELEEQLQKEKEKLAEKARKEQEKQEAKERKEKARQEAKLRREQIKQTAEYRRRAKIRRIILCIVAGIVLIAAAVFLIDRYVQLKHYSIVSSFEMTNIDENSDIYPFHDGYVKIAGDGITYFDKNGIVWNEILTMADPVCDVCGEYIAITDMKSTEVSIYGKSGFLNKFNLTRVSTGVEISRYGTVAVATNEGDSNYIEVKDQTGSDIATVKTVFSSTGYLTDIALSPDGTKLAASYILVDDGNIESKVVFYDFSKNSNQGENVTIGEFDQYKSTLITTLEFMDGNRLAAIGDNAFTIYSVGSVPTIVYEDLAYPWPIDSLFFSNDHIGFIVENDESEDAYSVKAYNLSGKLVCDQSFDFAYNHVSFAGNAVLLYSNYDCDVFNFAGTHKFSYTFDNRIYTMESCGDNINYILLLQGQTQFIKLR